MMPSGIEPYLNRVICGDALEVLKGMPDGSVQCCVTSPPYWGLRDYGVDGQIGLEQTPDEYVSKMVEVFRDVRRVLRNDGVCWVNLGDSYAGSWGNYHPRNGGSWDDYEWIACADGKLRRAPFSAVELVDGIPTELFETLEQEDWPHRSILGALGNSVVPAVCVQIMHAVKTAHEGAN